MRESLREQVRQSLAERGILEDGGGDALSRFAPVFARFDVIFEHRWPRCSVLELYRRLLKTRPDLQIPAQESHTQSPEAPGNDGQIGLEDIAPLAYLRLRVGGPIPIRPSGDPDTAWSQLDHIVVDEAQDLSPLALSVLRVHADGLTVLGDMNQAIYGHRGTRKWEELIPSLGNGVRQIHTLSPTYRSTQQIADLANYIVRTGSLDGGVCKSFPRTGTEPELIQAESVERMREKVTAFVNAVCSAPGSTVAILTRTAANARTTFGSIAEHLAVPAVCITDRRQSAESRVVIMPAYLAKGIEFDAVAVMDVDATAYTTTVNDATLLYVAVTRALHRLLVTWTGQPSPLIAGRI
jgi:DNA helicase-2/ATP-dependent DNA helicase PcrA